MDTLTAVTIGFIGGMLFQLVVSIYVINHVLHHLAKVTTPRLIRPAAYGKGSKR
jgi:hypothetical protein